MLLLTELILIVNSVTDLIIELKKKNLSLLRLGWKIIVIIALVELMIIFK